jgi:H+-transporting ATPase
MHKSSDIHSHFDEQRIPWHDRLRHLATRLGIWHSTAAAPVRNRQADEAKSGGTGAVTAIDSEQAAQLEMEETYARLQAGPDGLDGQTAAARLSRFGRNTLTEKQTSPLARFLGYFWGPIPWMIEIAAVLSAFVRHWDDFAIIAVMLLFNAGVGYWQEYKAASALEALKARLALKARVRRDGRWQEVDAGDLVPGDVIRLRLGDIVPADAKLFEGDYLAIDQSALTGESLPVEKKSGEVAYSGSVVKQGEMVALVTATGGDTFFGRTARLVETAGAASHFQKAVMTIGDYLIHLSLALVAVLVLAQLYRHAPLLELLQFALILIVASIPVAMPAVLSVTMAVGALALSKLKAIVSRLQSIEEMAGIDILCSDKTGTLTQNQLTLGDPLLFAADDAQELILCGALASKAEDKDAIDLAIIGGLTEPQRLERYRQARFVPFDPVSKRTEAEIEPPDGKPYKVTKGAPQVILELAKVTDEEAARANRSIDDFASRGFRTLGVARTDASGAWHFLGILPLFDPPRTDSRTTIHRASEHGIAVKMITGDNIAIAREIAGQLEMGRNIQTAKALFNGDDARPPQDAVEQIEAADGFAQVFPEHKYGIVKALQQHGHLVAMTGDGVNDAPALKQADVGIAVSGATDAARAAADLILTAPGLSTIVSAVEEARRIFERMNSYAIYRITETIRIMLFMVVAMLVYDFYPITAIMIIMLALLNDIPIMTIAYDNTWMDPSPVRWQMHRVLTIATVLGIIGVAETFLLLVITHTWLGLSMPVVQTIIFLKLSIAGHLTLFVARTKRPFFTRPFPAAALLGAILGTQVIAALIAGLGIFVTPIPWSYIGLIWVYCLIWAFIEDLAKLASLKLMEHRSQFKQGFLNSVNKTLHPGAGH